MFDSYLSRCDQHSGINGLPAPLRKSTKFGELGRQIPHTKLSEVDQHLFAVTVGLNNDSLSKLRMSHTVTNVES